MGHMETAFKNITTLRVGGPIADFRSASSPAELAQIVTQADAQSTPLVVVGCGSNLLAGDDVFEGTVVRACDTARPMALTNGTGDEGVRVKVNVGCVWDDFVRWCVERDLAGLEALSGIPGQIGSAVMQNLGAYGQEIGTCLTSATLLDRTTGVVDVVGRDRLGLGYRTSMLRRSMDEGQDGGRWAATPRWVVLDAEFTLHKQARNHVDHAQLARALSCETGCEMELGAIRDSVYEVRASKGMVADPDPEGPSPIYDRWSSGSFFTNPVLTREQAAAQLPEGAPLYPAHDDAHVKTSAAWLIDQAGFHKGWGVHGEASKATLSTLHTLAMTNRGHATSADVVELAQAVKDGVYDRFGVTLRPETVLVGTSLH